MHVYNVYMPVVTGNYLIKSFCLQLPVQFENSIWYIVDILTNTIAILFHEQSFVIT